jgi:hypothetical protein
MHLDCRVATNTSRLLLVAAVFLAVGGRAHAQIVRDMTPDRIREAISFGTKTKELSPYRIQEKARWSWPPLIALYTTPFLRVALAANTAKKQYRTFTEANVTPEMIAPEIHVYATSKSSGVTAIANVTTIVLLPHDSKNSQQAVHPVRMTAASEQYKNLFGFTGEGQGVLAVFPLEVWTGDKDLHVVFDTGIPNENPFGTGGLGGCTDCKSRIYLEKIR